MARREFGEKHYHSFGGTSIKATFGHREIGSLQAVSYAVQREKAPIYTLGNVNPMAFSRNKRGIAGTMVFVMFDGHALLQEMGIYSPEAIISGPDATGPTFLANKREFRPQFSGIGTVDIAAAPDVDEIVSGSDDLTIDLSRGYERHLAWFVDQIPPFDVTITGVNEYGAAISMMIIGVELMNEGWGISVDDVVAEQQYTYVCRTITPWRPIKRWRIANRGGDSAVVDYDST